MAVALTSFVQPMLVANQSSDSVTNDLTTRNECQEPLSICRSPSASPPSHSFSPCALNHSEQPIDGGTKLMTNLSDSFSHTHSFSDIDITPKSTLDGAQHRDNDSETSVDDTDTEHSLSRSQCRYCYSDTLRSCNVSQCHCTGTLCEHCLVKELKMTYQRKNHPLHCTVCKSEYKVQTDFSFQPRRDCGKLCFSSLMHCGLKDEQYLLDSVGGKLGFLLVIVGIATWIVSTSLLFAFPPNGCPVELYYMVSAFDFAVGMSTMWFILKCRYLSPALLSVMYGVRTVYLFLGWLPSINLCRIYEYHQIQNDHTVVLAYFVGFSLLASMMIGFVSVRDVRRQYHKFAKDNGTLVLREGAIIIEITDIVNAEGDEF